jgi:hypothetical protein
MKGKRQKKLPGKRGFLPAGENVYTGSGKDPGPGLFCG